MRVTGRAADALHWAARRCAVETADPKQKQKSGTKREGPVTPAFLYRCSLPGLAGFKTRC